MVLMRCEGRDDTSDHGEEKGEGGGAVQGREGHSGTETAEGVAGGRRGIAG